MKHFIVPSFCFVSLALTVGCGGGVSDAPTLAKVAGTIMVDGKPKGGLTVEFHPDSNAGTTGPMSIAETNDDGSFILATATGRAGAVIGNHKVVVKCPWSLEGRSGGGSVTADGFGSSQDGQDVAPAPAASTEKCTVNIRFEDPDQTTLSAIVPEEGVGDLLLQVTTK